MTKKQKKHLLQKQNNIEDIDVNNILIFKKEPYGNKNLVKYFFG